MRNLWLALKVALSAVLLAVLCLTLFMFIRKPDDFALLGAAAMFLFMTALLWVNLTSTSRELGWVGVVLSAWFLFIGAQTFTGTQAFPLVCTGKRLWCELENVLYMVGGPALAAAPFILVGAVGLYASARFVVRRSLAG